jgi:hypothetical protein
MQRTLRSASSVSLVAPRFFLLVADGTSAECSRYRRDTEDVHQRRSIFSLEACWVSISVGGGKSTECWAFLGNAENNYQQGQSCSGAAYQNSVPVGDDGST